MERESFGTFANGHPSLPAAAAGLWPDTSSYFPSSCVRIPPTSLPDSCNNLIHIFPQFSGWNLGPPHGLRPGRTRVLRFSSHRIFGGGVGAGESSSRLLACSFLAILAEPAQIGRSSSFCDFLGSCCGFFAVFFGCGRASQRDDGCGLCCCGAWKLWLCRFQSRMQLDSLAGKAVVSQP